MVEQKPSKLTMRVRFPSPAPGMVGGGGGSLPAIDQLQNMITEVQVGQCGCLLFPKSLKQN